MAEKRLEFWPARSPVCPIAFITMARDEEIFLKAWIENGLRVHKSAVFYIIDHASVVPLAETLKDFIEQREIQANFIRLPAVPFDDDFKAMSLSGLAKSLVHCYDVVVVSDCDELLVGLKIPMENVYEELLKIERFAAPIGFEIVQHTMLEGEFNPAVPILQQRNFGFFAGGYTKPVIWRGRTEFGAGLHKIRDDFLYLPNLALLHLRSVDKVISDNRANLRRQYELSESQKEQGRGVHWRRPIEQKVDLFRKLREANMLTNAGSIMPNFLDGMKESYGMNGAGFWGHNISMVSEFTDLRSL